MSSRLLWSVSQRCGEEEITRQMVLRDSMGRNTQDGLSGPGKSISIHCVEDTRNLQGWWCHLQKKNIPGTLELSLLHMTSGPSPFLTSLEYSCKET